MELREQKYVCMLAECQNLTRAAERLYISQPALSLSISNLEKSLGTPLFERKNKKFVLTYAGERYVEKASQMLQLEREFNQEIAHITRQTAGRLRLGISQRRGDWLLPPVIAAYERQWPEIDLVIREGNLSDLTEMLKNHELDMVVLNLDHAPSDMDTALLFEEEILAAFPEGHPLLQKAEKIDGSPYLRIRPEELAGETLILHSPMQSLRVLEDAILKRHHVKPGRTRVIRSIETSVQMSAEGLGISFVREGYISHLHYSKPVVYCTLDTQPHRQKLVAAYKKDVELPKYMTSMIELLRAEGEHFAHK